jgi:hypothetical protein
VRTPHGADVQGLEARVQDENLGHRADCTGLRRRGLSQPPSARVMPCVEAYTLDEPPRPASPSVTAALRAASLSRLRPWRAALRDGAGFALAIAGAARGGRCPGQPERTRTGGRT